MKNQEPNLKGPSILKRVLFLFASTISSARCILTLQDEYHLTPGFNLTFDMLSLFAGNNLEFSIDTNPKVSDVQLTSKLIDVANWTFPSPNIKHFEVKLPYIIVLAEDVNEESGLSEVTLYKAVFDADTQNITYTQKKYPDNDNYTMYNCTVRSAEIISATGNFYFNLFYSMEKEEEVKEKMVKFEIFEEQLGYFELSDDLDKVNILGQEKPDKVLFEDYVEAEVLMTQKSISVFSEDLFRTVYYPKKLFNGVSLKIQYMNISKLEELDYLDFKDIMEFNTNVVFTELQIYDTDLFLGFSNKIERVELVPETKKISKIHSVNLASSISLTLQIDDHLDVLSATNGTTVDVIRWDEFEAPIVLIPMDLGPNPVVFLDSSYDFSLFLTNTDDIIIKRFSESQNYLTLKSTGSASQVYINPDDQLLYIDANNTLMIQNLTTTVVARIQASESTEVTFTAKESNPTNQVQATFTKKFNITMIPPNTKLFNTEDTKTQGAYLTEQFESQSLVVKPIPDKWFIGNRLNMDTKCTSGNVTIPESVYSIQELKDKQMNLIFSEKSSKNIFYYELYSQPLDDGSYSMVIQIELEIYFQKCKVSRLNLLKCITWNKVEETNMVLEGTLVRDEYFIYKTNEQTKAVQFDSNNVPIVTAFMGARATCTFQVLQKIDVLFCVNFEDRTFHTYYLTGGLKEVVQLKDVYANKIAVSEFHPSVVFVSTEDTIEIRSVRTGVLINVIDSEVTQQLDSSFKICGNIMMVLSPALNTFEEYDISELRNPLLITSMNVMDFYGYQIQTNTRLGFHFGCQESLPLIVNDGKHVKGLIVRLGAIPENKFRDQFIIGDSTYYANYFIEAIDLSDTTKFTKERVVWSFLDTSNGDVDEFGGEVATFGNQQMIFDFRKLEPGKKDLDFECKLTVTPPESIDNSITIDFTLTVNKNSIKIYLEDEEGDYVANMTKTKKIDMFEAFDTVEFPNFFIGEVLTYNFNISENDYQSAIQRYSIINNYQDLTSIMRCSREQTLVLDVYISHTGSIYPLTQNAMFKIKNGTTYSVQNFMYLSNTGSEGFQCHRVLLNEARNIIISLCDRAKIPYFVVSNWNSMKPYNAFSTQIEFTDISSISFSFINDFEIFAFGNPNFKVVQTQTAIYKYRLVHDTSTGVSIAKIGRTDVDEVLEFCDMVIHTNNKTSIKTSYFVGLSGDMTDSTSATLTVLMDNKDQKKIDSLFKASFDELLKSSNASRTFSRLKNLKCTLNDQNTADYLISFSCFALQNKNFHYEFNFTVSASRTVSHSYTAGYIAYGDFLTNGPLDIHGSYVAMVASKPNWVPPEDQQENISALPSTFLVVYNRTEKGKIRNLIGGVPLPNLDGHNTIVKVVTIRGREFVILSGKTYYSMVALELKFNNSLVIYKNKTAQEITINSLNHYSSATLVLKLEDDTLKYFLMIIGFVLLLVVLSLLVIAWCKRGDEKNKNTTFDVIDGMLMVDQYEMGTEEEEEFERLGEDPDNISDYFTSGLTAVHQEVEEEKRRTQELKGKAEELEGLKQGR